MPSVRKFKLVPHSMSEGPKKKDDNEQIGAGGSVDGDVGQLRTGNSFKAHAEDRQKKLVQIILKLARIQGYNDQNQIKKRDGTYMEDTDITALMLFAVTKEKLMLGLSEFIDLLLEAGIGPDDVINENLKHKLALRSGSRRVQTTSLVDQQTPEPVIERPLPPPPPQEPQSPVWELPSEPQSRPVAVPVAIHPPPAQTMQSSLPSYAQPYLTYGKRTRMDFEVDESSDDDDDHENKTNAERMLSHTRPPAPKKRAIERPPQTQFNWASIPGPSSDVTVPPPPAALHPPRSRPEPMDHTPQPPRFSRSRHRPTPKKQPVKKVGFTPPAHFKHVALHPSMRMSSSEGKRKKRVWNKALNHYEFVSSDEE